MVNVNESKCFFSGISEFYKNLLNYSEKFVTMNFMRKYIHLAKAIKPQLSQEAIDIIAEEYSKLRTYDLEQNDLCRVSITKKKEKKIKLKWFNNFHHLIDTTDNGSNIGNIDSFINGSCKSSSFEID